MLGAGTLSFGRCWTLQELVRPWGACVWRRCCSISPFFFCFLSTMSRIVCLLHLFLAESFGLPQAQNNSINWQRTKIYATISKIDLWTDNFTNNFKIVFFWGGGRIWDLKAIHLVSHFVSAAITNTMTQENLGGGVRVYFANRLQFIVGRSQCGDWSTNHRGLLFTGLLPLTCSTTFLIQPRPTA